MNIQESFQSKNRRECGHSIKKRGLHEPAKSDCEFMGVFVKHLRGA